MKLLEVWAYEYCRSCGGVHKRSWECAAQRVAKTKGPVDERTRRRSRLRIKVRSRAKGNPIIVPGLIAGHRFSDVAVIRRRGAQRRREAA